MRTSEVEGFAHSSMLTLSSGGEHDSRKGEGGNGRLTDEVVSRSMSTTVAVSWGNHHLAGKIAV